MINKEELEIMTRIGNHLLNCDIKLNQNDIKQYFQILEKLNQKRQKRNKISQAYNKKNYEYYSAMKNFYNNKKKGNKEKEDYWFNKAQEIKKGVIK